MLNVTLCREVPMTLKKNSMQVSQYLIFRRRRLSRISVPKSQKSRQYLLKGELWWKFFQIKAPVKREKKERKKLRKKAGKTSPHTKPFRLLAVLGAP